jgi:hypothetical protein
VAAEIPEAQQTAAALAAVRCGTEQTKALERLTKDMPAAMVLLGL